MDEVEHAHEQHGLGLEASLVVLVGKNEEHILQDADEELVEESVGRVDVSLLSDVVDELEAHVKARSLDIAVIVLAGPHARVNDELELTVVELQKRREAVEVDSAEEVEEFDTMLGVFGKVLVDHVQRALEDVLHDDWYLVLHQSRELGDHGGHGPQDLGVTSTRHVTVVVNQHGIQERRHHLLPHGLEVLSLVDVGLNELENLLLDGPETTDLGHLGSNLTLASNSLRNQLTGGSIHLKHVAIQVADLREEVGTDR